MNRNQSEGKDLYNSRKWVILQAVMLGTFMAPLDASIVNTVLPSFTTVFDVNISIVQWVPTAYLLTISSIILFWGRLGDIFGHKKIFLSGLLSFTCASFFCGLSTSIWMLIIFRTMQGIGAAMLMAVGPALVTKAFLPSERGKALGTFATSIAIALTLGPTLGGIIAEHTSWRVIFFINVPIGLVAILFGLKAIPPTDTNPNQKLDWHGAITAFIFLLSLLLYANRGMEWGWSSPFALGLLLSTGLFGSWFIRTELKVAQPMLNFNLFKIRNFTLGNTSLLLYFMVSFIFIFLMPFYLILVLKLPISQVGLIMATSPLVMLVISPISGTLSDYIGSRILSCLGLGICTISMLWLSTLSRHSTPNEVIIRLLAFSFGASIFQTPNNSLIMGSVPKRYLGIASGMLANMRNLGMVLGIAVGGAVFYNIAPVASIKNTILYTEAEMWQMIIGFKVSFQVGAGICVAAVLSSLFSRSIHRQPQSPKSHATKQPSRKEINNPTFSR